ncbi:MAG: hypothetical protein ACREI3_04200 [Nitrospirales bacterium]
MHRPLSFTQEELALVADDRVFPAKARITKKVRHLLEEVHAGLQEEMRQVVLLAPPGFDPAKFQFVKGEHLEDFPYQYLDFPKHFDGREKFTFRSLFWWGHHVVFALILEGAGLRRYKQNLVNRYHRIAGRDLCLGLGPTLWEWKQGEGYTMPLTHDRKSRVSAVLSNRPFVKVARFIPLTEAAFATGRMVELGRETFRSLLPVMTEEDGS